MSRHAFGEDLYAAGRWANLTRYGGRTITTQEQLSLAFESCRIALGEDASDEDLALLARMVAGSEALGIEEEQRPEAPPPVAALMNSALFGGVVDPLSRAGYTLMPVVAPWPLTVFRAVAPGRTAYIAIPRDWLPAFEEAGGAGRLDEVLRAYLGMPPSGRRLASAAQAAAPGIYDEIGPGLLLLPGERDPGPISPLMQASAADPTVQVAASSPSGGTAITALAGARPGKAPSTVVEVTETSRSIPWLLIALVTALIAVIVGVLVLVTGGSSGTEQPPAVATASPAPATGESTVAAAPVPPVVTDLRKVFVRPVTTWSVIAHDPVGGALTYVWLLTPDVPTERCGKPLAPWTQTGPQATWSHDSIPPDNCPRPSDYGPCRHGHRDQSAGALGGLHHERHRIRGPAKSIVPLMLSGGVPTVA